MATVIRYDARGHGQSGASADPHDYTLVSLAWDMLGIANQLNLKRFVTGGASLGCARALYAAVVEKHLVQLVEDGKVRPFAVPLMVRVLAGIFPDCSCCEYE